MILSDIDWIGLQNSFRQQYSKIGNTREQQVTHGDLFISVKIQRQ